MKKKTVLILTLFVLALALTVTSSRAQSPLGTAFTYQGQLKNAGGPVNDTCDFQFSLWDDVSGGTQIGTTQTVSGVAVTDGLFTVQLDFGAAAFQGDARWLAIAVQCSGDSAYTDLTPRQALTAAPYASYALQAPWSGLSGVPAGFADGVDNDTTYTAGDGLELSGTQFRMKGASYQNVVIVAKSGGDFTSIQSALNSITDASDTNRYLVWVAPGVYTERVTMKSYVDIEGAGELTTKITYTGSVDDNTGTVVGADNAELRFLTVENTGGNEYANAIYNNSASPRLTHITASASGGTKNYGVHNAFSSPTMTNVTASAAGGTTNQGVHNYNSSPTMTNVTARASGGHDSFGVVNFDSSSPVINHSVISASGATNNYGMRSSDSSPVINNSGISASGGTNINYGMYNYASSPIVSNSGISAGGATNNYGIYNTVNTVSSDTYTVRVNNSQISGSTGTISNDSGFTTRVGGSQLSGGAVYVGGGTLTCAGVYDEDYTFYASTCP